MPDQFYQADLHSDAESEFDTADCMILNSETEMEFEERKETTAKMNKELKARKAGLVDADERKILERRKKAFSSNFVCF